MLAGDDGWMMVVVVRLLLSTAMGKPPARMTTPFERTSAPSQSRCRDGRHTRATRLRAQLLAPPLGRPHRLLDDIPHPPLLHTGNRRVRRPVRRRHLPPELLRRIGA